MKDNEIIKALECCSNTNCKECPYNKDEEIDILDLSCVINMTKHTIDLINRQKAEIKELKEDNEIKSQKRANIFEIVSAFERGQNQGYKKFAEKLKERSIAISSQEVIKETLEELTEGGTDNENQRALDWLYRQLKKKRIALGNAERKPNKSESELNDISSAIELIEYIIGVVLKDGGN